MPKNVGQIWRYNKKTDEGTIVGRNNQQYSFSLKDYHGKTELKEGNMVKFKVDGQSAKEIKLLT